MIVLIGFDEKNFESIKILLSFPFVPFSQGVS